MSTPQKVIPITRREMSSGLAFAEERDLQRLSTWAAEGWRLAKIEHLWMILEQAPPEQFFEHPQTDRAQDFLSKILGH